MKVNRKNIDHLIIKFMENKLNEQESVRLKELLKNQDNKSYFDSYVELNYTLNSKQKFRYETSFELARRELDKNSNRVFPRLLKYAAVAILFIGVGYFFQQGFFTSEPALVIPDDVITLQLDNGDIEIIKIDGSTEVVDKEGNVVGTQKGSLLVYDNEVVKETLVYNTITVPYGKRFEIQLSDGTNVHLNAGTSLKYPIKFIEGENRQVFLDGEAYFDVTKDESHPFIVNADELDVRVLGTQFNISSYPEDEHINTVLVEGSVSLYNKDEIYNPETSTIIKPGFKAAWEKTNNKIEIEEADTEIYTAWINGDIRFRHMPFKNIIKKLERHYNVVFVNHNKEIENRLFTASFKTETIEQVLLSFNKNYAIDYTIKNNQIIIN